LGAAVSSQSNSPRYLPEVPRSKFANGDFEMVNVSQVSCDNHPVSRGKPFDMILHVILAKFLETA